MTHGSPIGLILATALPLMLGNVFQQLYTLVDTSVVGQGIGLEALAALGSADWFNWLFLGIAQGIAQGFSIPLAQAFGAKDHDDLRKYAGNAVLLSLAAALLLPLIALLSIRPALGWMGAPAGIRPITIRYLTVLFSGLPIVMAYNLLSGMLRALGNSRTPLMAMATAAVTNIALDALFVLKFRWGVESAAAATLIAQTVSCVFCLVKLRQVEFMRLSRDDLQADPGRIRHLIRLGLPLSGQNCIIAIGGMIVQTVVNTMGVAFIAGYTATNKLYGLLEIAAVSYGYAMSTYCGQNLGARRFDRIRAGMRSGLIAGVATAALIALAMFTGGRLIVGMFIDDSAMADRALSIALEFLRLMAAFLPILYLLHIYRSALQGMGNALTPMLSGLAELVMRTGAALLLPALIGYSGVFWAEILAWIGADLLLIPSYYATYRKYERRSQKAEPPAQ